MGLSRTVSEIDGDFSRNSQNFPTLVYCASLLTGFPLELGTGARGQKNRRMGLPGRERSLTISLAVWIQCMHQRDRWTDGRTDTGRQQRPPLPPLRIASHGNNPQENQLLLTNRATHLCKRKGVVDLRRKIRPSLS